MNEKNTFIFLNRNQHRMNVTSIKFTLIDNVSHFTLISMLCVCVHSSSAHSISPLKFTVKFCFMKRRRLCCSISIAMIDLVFFCY